MEEIVTNVHYWGLINLYAFRFRKHLFRLVLAEAAEVFTGELLLASSGLVIDVA